MSKTHQEHKKKQLPNTFEHVDLKFLTLITVLSGSFLRNKIDNNSFNVFIYKWFQKINCKL